MAEAAGVRAPAVPRPIEVALLASVFIVAACGLVYELAAGALASYVLGDSVLQFSTVIGTYLFAMGVGSWASRFFERQLPAHFLRIELLVALAGGFMPALLFVANAWLVHGFRALLYALVFAIGVLVGIEIPLVMRILKRNVQLRELVSQVLTFDYLGALAVSIAFPLVLVPQLGLVRTGLLFGLLNVAVAVWTLRVFRHEIRRALEHAVACVAAFALLVAGFALAERITTFAEDRLFQDPVVFAATSPYQRIVVTHGRAGYRLFLNGNLQFAERDEYRYHEALVHPAMAAQGAPRKVAILGGGDGLAAREVLRYAGVESVTLVELDANMTHLFSTNEALVKLNGGSLRSGKLKVVNADAFRWLQDTNETFDVIIVDFPDPTNFSIGKLYTTSFYALMEKRLAASGYAVIQTTSPLVARESYWTVVSTLEAVGLQVAPYHANVPSFGEWGFVIASRRPYRLPGELPAGMKFHTREMLPLLFDFPRDMARVPAQPNRLSNQVLVTTYEREWGKALP
jgi:spermidine synthase